MQAIACFQVLKESLSSTFPREMADLILQYHNILEPVVVIPISRREKWNTLCPFLAQHFVVAATLSGCGQDDDNDPISIYDFQGRKLCEKTPNVGDCLWNHGKSIISLGSTWVPE